MTHLRPAFDPRDAEALMGLRRSMRVARVAEALDIDPAAVRQMVHDGILEGFRSGKRGIRVYQDSVEEYCRQRRLGKPADHPTPAPKKRRSGPTAATREAMAALREMGVFG